MRSDRALLERLRARAATVRPENDPKLKLLVEELARIAADAERTGISEADIRNRRKVLIFSYFADTVEWIAGHLEDVLKTDRRLARFRGRIAVVRGTDSYEGTTRSDAVFGFAPESTEGSAGTCRGQVRHPRYNGRLGRGDEPPAVWSDHQL